MLSLPHEQTERCQRWRRAAELLLDQADVAAVSRQVHLALFYDAQPAHVRQQARGGRKAPLAEPPALRLTFRLMCGIGCVGGGGIGLSEGYDRATVNRWVAVDRQSLFGNFSPAPHSRRGFSVGPPCNQLRGSALGWWACCAPEGSASPVWQDI